MTLEERIDTLEKARSVILNKIIDIKSEIDMYEEDDNTYDEEILDSLKDELDSIDKQIDYLDR